MIFEWKISMTEPYPDGKVGAIYMLVGDERYVRAIFQDHEANALGTVLTGICRQTEEFYDKLESENRYPVTPAIEAIRAFDAMVNPPISRPRLDAFNECEDGRKRDRKPSAAGAAEEES